MRRRKKKQSIESAYSYSHFQCSSSSPASYIINPLAGEGDRIDMLPGFESFNK